MLLELGATTAKNAQGLTRCRGIDTHQSEPTDDRTVGLDVMMELRKRGGADDAEPPLTDRLFEGLVALAERRPLMHRARHELVHLVDEQDDLRVRAERADQRGHPLLVRTPSA